MFNQDNGLTLVTGFLNSEDVAYAGGYQGLAGAPGELGQIVSIGDALALKLSKIATGTLYGGLYQKVQFKSGSSASNIRGGALIWYDRANFIVTPDLAAVTEGDFAGIGLMANTKGNYGFIQVAGKCTIQYRASVTDTNVSDLVLQLTTTNTFDAIADATGSYISGGTKGLKNIVGVAIEAPANSGLKTASIWARNLNIK
jgi:hypothetical protein